MPNLTIATFNVENLFARFKFKDKVDPSQAARDGWQVDSTKFDIFEEVEKNITGKCIDKISADVLCLQEVENADVLKRFRNNFLKGGSKRYPYVALMDGNDPRFIDVAVLSAHPIVRVRSWQHLRTGSSFLFSRDCLEVDLEVGGKPLTAFVNHFKSMMEGRAETRARRQRQARAVLDIVTARFGKSAGKHPFVIVGDLNDYLEPGNGIEALAHWNQVENVVERLPPDERWTHYFHGGKEYRQLDYLLVSKSLAKKTNAPPHIERSGQPRRAKLYTGARLEGVDDNDRKASDHCPVSFELSL